MPTDRIIDGKDLRPLMQAQPDAVSPHAAFFYYIMHNLMAVRVGKWKLHVNRMTFPDKKIAPLAELYDLEADIGETSNLYDPYPAIVAELEAHLAACRQDMGDDVTGITGQNVRPVGCVDSPRTLTAYDPEHPYIIAMYDLQDRG